MRLASPAALVIAAGMCAALHVAKLPPALGALQQALGITLVQAGVLLSLVQVAGMTLGLAFGALADGLGARRSMVLGLALLGGASVLGAAASGAPALMMLRVVEGFGFLLVVLPAPGLLRQLVAPARIAAVLGVWGSYMPLGTAAALLTGPLWLAAFGWQAWWILLGVLSLGMAALLLRGVRVPAASHALKPDFLAGARATLAAPNAWLLSTMFAMYSAQWLAVVGFLPTVYAQAGVGAAATGVLTALVAALNALGNVAAGRLLQRGVPPSTLLAAGFIVMGLGSTAAFAGTPGLGAEGRYVAALLFTGFGGLIPATAFTLALRVAPAPHAVSATMGWLQQWSALGQFAGPPLVAAIASAVGGWQWTWLATGSFATVGLVLAGVLVRRLK